MSNETQDVDALERLESRVLEIVEQLRETKKKLSDAEEQVESLREKLRLSEERAKTVETDRSRTQAGREELRKRIEALIGRIESMEE